MMNADWFVLGLLAIFGLLPIVYSVVLFILTLRQLDELQEGQVRRQQEQDEQFDKLQTQVRQLSYERTGIQDVVETIGQHLGDIEGEIIDVKELKNQLTFIQMQTNRMVDLFTILNAAISAIIDNMRGRG